MPVCLGRRYVPRRAAARWRAAHCTASPTPDKAPDKAPDKTLDGLTWSCGMGATCALLSTPSSTTTTTPPPTRQNSEAMWGGVGGRWRSSRQGRRQVRSRSRRRRQRPSRSPLPSAPPPASPPKRSADRPRPRGRHCSVGSLCAPECVCAQDLIQATQREQCVCV